MNYRHAFHAGNFADVLKHAVLALVIEHLKRKPTPFRVIDTHAGTGLYRLDAGEAMRTGEWRDGIGRLLGPDAKPLPESVRLLLAPYLGVVSALNPAGGISLYPGSPCLALALMREADRLIASELHPEDAAMLEARLARDPRAKVLALDGWQALKAMLPPKEKRGVVLVDPPFEAPGEAERLVQGLAAGVRRFATGTYLLWLPLKTEAAARALKRDLAALGVAKLLYAELRVGVPSPEAKLSATGLAILNPPYQLDAQLNTLLPHLADRLARDSGAGAAVEWLSPPG